MNEQRRGYLPGKNFERPSEEKAYDSEYVMPSEQLLDLRQKARDAVTVYEISLATAGTLWVQRAGYHFCLYGHDGSTIKTVNTTAYSGVYINKESVDPTADPYPAKHARGYSGPFAQLFLSWPAQSGVYASLVVYHSDRQPWIDGESCT